MTVHSVQCAKEYGKKADYVDWMQRMKVSHFCFGLSIDFLVECMALLQCCNILAKAFSLSIYLSFNSMKSKFFSDCRFMQTLLCTLSTENSHLRNRHTERKRETMYVEGFSFSKIFWIWAIAFPWYYCCFWYANILVFIFWFDIVSIEKLRHNKRIRFCARIRS